MTCLMEQRSARDRITKRRKHATFIKRTAGYADLHPLGRVY